MKYWTKQADVPCQLLLRWSKLRTSKYHEWKKRYGQVNSHNGKIPRDWSAIGSITPADCPAVLSPVIGEERDRKLESASERRQQRRATAKQHVA